MDFLPAIMESLQRKGALKKKKQQDEKGSQSG